MPPDPPHGSGTAEPSSIAPDVFCGFISRRAGTLLALADHLGRGRQAPSRLTRPLLAAVFGEAAQMEELLDAYGARRNHRWHRFRHLVAAAKRFANAGYKLLHIHYAAPRYRLLAVNGDFFPATDACLDRVGRILRTVGREMTRNAEALGMTFSDLSFEAASFVENLPAGVLPQDRRRRETVSAAESINHMATAFLNLAAESECIQTPRRVDAVSYPACIPDPVGEVELRQLEQKFHNLQSMYDTHIADTHIELTDPDLPFLRGHVSVVYHLLETAVDFCHYYERHLASDGGAPVPDAPAPIVEPDTLLEMLMDYSLGYAGRYIEAARTLCHGMLRRYAEVGRVTVPVPRYRGFHVRPSTLVAKIARHYGSELKMYLGNEEYDAASPLDLFRANEKINAVKRRRLAQEIGETTFLRKDDTRPDGEWEGEGSPGAAVRRAVLHLAEKNKLVIYERPLPVGDIEAIDGKPLAQLVLEEVTRLLAMGKIDLEADIRVTFVGDTRILDDIELLARNGYGEDSFGNNIPLPNELRYLRL